MTIISVIIAAIPFIFAIAMAIDLTRESTWWKRKHNRCWHFRCSRTVTNCLAGPNDNGPMCDLHCASASYHEWFCGCHQPYGIPLKDTFLSDPTRIPIFVQGRRIDNLKLLN